MDCLDNIIGISETECECLTDQLPASSDEAPTYNVSASGIFLDDLEGFNINIASGADDCADGGIWQRMAKAIENAKKDFVRSFLSCVSQLYISRLKNFSWQLGRSQFTGSLTSITGTHFGMRISPLQLKGGFIYIKKIGIIINQSVPVTVQVYSDADGGTILFENSATPVNAIADTLTWATLSTPLELPMWDSSGHYIRYYILILQTGNFKPKNNQDCDCSGKRPYLQWLDLIGVEGSDVTNLLGFRSSGKYMNGITLDVDVKCKTTEVICSSEYPLDFVDDGNAMNMAVCIQLRAGARLYEDILSSDNINRFTMLNREKAQQNIDKWNGQYQEAVIKMCEDVHIEANDCLICKQNKTRLQKNLIKA